MVSSYSPIHFDAQGNPLLPGEEEAIFRFLLNGSFPVTDLWIFAHGWRTAEGQADKMYNKWVHLMQEEIKKGSIDSMYHPLFIGIYWPSVALMRKKSDIPAPSSNDLVFSPDLGEFEEDFDDVTLPDEQGEPKTGNDRASFEIEEPGADEYLPVFRLMEKGAFIELYGDMDEFKDSSATDYKRDFEFLYDVLAMEVPTPNQLEAFLRILYRYRIDDPHLEENERNNITQSFELAYTYLLSHSHTLTTSELFSAHSDPFQFFQAFTFWTMKARSAVVGQHGVAAFLGRVKDELLRRQRNVHIHLLGHSFGAKLLTAAVYGLANDPHHFQAPIIDSLILLLGAFSQFSFSSRVPFKPDSCGRYATLLEQRVLANPITAIYSLHDLANRHCYPWGMFADYSHFPYERGDAGDRLGSLGVNGIQGMKGAICRAIDLSPLNMPYTRGLFENIAYLNVDAQHIINTYADRYFVGAHGDIYHPEIFQLALALSLH